jgi:hypothetical protein
MYSVDERDEVVALEGLPQSSVGAPMPIVLADEHRVILAYYVEERTPDWDGSTARVVYPGEGTEPIAIVRFSHCRAHLFGPPNDEAFAGHPLASRGLKPYSAFEVKESSWIRHLERMNSVHPYHRPEAFWQLRHLVFAFHDSTFECVCRSFDVQSSRGSLKSVLPTMAALLEWEAN